MEFMGIFYMLIIYIYTYGWDSCGLKDVDKNWQDVLTKTMGCYFGSVVCFVGCWFAKGLQLSTRS